MALTLQEIFDKASKHMLSQNCRSMNLDNTNCMYRGEEGRMCGVGPFIKDEFYSEQMEGEGVRSEIVMTALMESGVIDQVPNEHDKYNDSTLIFLARIQDIHDAHDVEDWAHALKNLAKNKGLEFNGDVSNDQNCI